ncbi:MAG TPA: UDP-N-acetylmuramoyl-tripeptide--D-alanyl-D-alanine ligase [Leucothrix mucor]|nr:UDP-N-acetylmuramoyl-tripeptide--D-alanyl-D-alanine ligase [Leucothrix mucor]
MSWLTLSQIAEMTGGVLYGDDREIESVSTDSRTVKSDQLFVALAGERFDAHDFVQGVADKAAAALVHKKIDCELPQILVADTLKALGVFAKEWRKQFVKPVIGLTGSNGKTTVKEMLAAILSTKGQVMATFGNLNNDIGLPLTVLRLRNEDDYAVIEMGANHFDEIAYLSNITEPNIALLNNAGAAHLEGFGDVEGVSRAKAEIFSGLSKDGVAVINLDDDYADYWLSCAKNRKVITFGFDEKADVQGEVDNQGLKISIAGKKILVQVTLRGHHNAMNALAASAAATAVGVTLEGIKQGLEGLKAVKGRLAPLNGMHGMEVIDDTYNANPDSARVAIDVLVAKESGKRVLVLGDMGELGGNAKQLHADIGLYAKAQGVDELYCLGDYSKQACKEFGEHGYSFDEINPLLEQLKQEVEQSMTVLVKGSRSMKMERVVVALTENKLNSVEAAQC